jgi:hypothetical protein
MTTKRFFWILWYICWYPMVRFAITLDYIVRRLCNGWGQIFRRFGLLAGTLFTMAIMGYMITGIPLLVLWFLGWRTYNNCYLPKLANLHNDWYAVQ